MKIFLTGKPGVGKSTLLNSIVDQVENKHGFCTREVQLDDIRIGFEAIASTGDRIALAGVNSVSTFRVSRYGVDVEGFEDFVSVLPEFDQDALLYIDEVGQMQLFAKNFRNLVEKYLNYPNSFIGTLSSIYSDDFTDRIRKRNDIKIIEVTSENRDRLKDEIARALVR